MGSKSDSDRRYDFEALRGIGALCVVAAHCATLFTTWSTGLSGLPENRWIAEIAWLLNTWLMPLFMLLAGASTFYSLRRRTIGGFVRQRAVRLLVPVACAAFAIVPVMMYLGDIHSGAFAGSFPAYYVHFFGGIYPSGRFSLLHFWFLAYLALYTFMALPVVAWLRTPHGAALIARMAGFVRRPFGLYAAALPLLAVQLGLWAIAPQPDLPVLVNDWARFALFFCLFVYGYVMMSDARFGEAIAREWPRAGIVAALTSAILFVAGMQEGFNPFRDVPHAYSWAYAGFHTVFIACTWSWLIFLLGAGRRFLNLAKPAVAYAGAASYGVYLLHPLVWPVVGIWVANWDVWPAVRYAGLLLCVTLGTLAFYEIARRVHPVCALMGLKPAEGHVLAGLHGWLVELFASYPVPEFGPGMVRWTTPHAAGHRM